MVLIQTMMFISTPEMQRPLSVPTRQIRLTLVRALSERRNASQVGAKVRRATARRAAPAARRDRVIRGLQTPPSSARRRRRGRRAAARAFVLLACRHAADYAVVNEVLAKGTGNKWRSWDQAEMIWHRMTVQLPPFKGGLGLTSQSASGIAAFYSSTSAFTGWLAQRSHVGYCLRQAQCLEDHTT